MSNPVRSHNARTLLTRTAKSESEAVKICRLYSGSHALAAVWSYVFGISIFTDHQPKLLSDKRIYVLNLAHVLAVRV